jgi:hypothetical protein
MYCNPTSCSLNSCFLAYICFNRPLTIVFKSCLNSNSLSIVLISSKVACKFKLSIIYASLNIIVLKSILQPPFGQNWVFLASQTHHYTLDCRKYQLFPMNLHLHTLFFSNNNNNSLCPIHIITFFLCYPTLNQP